MMPALRDDSLFLRGSLRANAAFSALSGALFTLAGAPLGRFLGVDALLVGAVGVNLLGFAAALVYFAGRPVLSRAIAMLIVTADLLWVVGTFALVRSAVFTAAGAVAALAVSGVVLLFAILQSIGTRRLGHHPPSTSPDVIDSR